MPAYHYYRAFVDEEVTGDDGRRLPFHPAPGGFGDNELSSPTSPVDLSRLTPAGLQLYLYGVQTALEERDSLLQKIRQAQVELDQMIYLATNGSHAISDGPSWDELEQRRRETARASARTTPLGAWADAPVRIPGGGRIAADAEERSPPGRTRSITPIVSQPNTQTPKTAATVSKEPDQ